MVRARRTSLALAAGLILITGCTSLSPHSLLSRLRGNRGTVVDCGEVEVGGPCCPEPVLENGGPALVGPGVGELTPLPTPQGSAPFLAPAPRLVPQPQGPAQSQPMPYTPQQ